jgi:uncharacterized phage protein (TIGR01671 family)
MRVHLYRGKPVNKADYTLYEGLYEPNVFNEGFVYGSLIVKGKKHYICIGVAGAKLNCLINNATVTLVEVIPETVGEYTNLTDKNGKKIFEGDILKPDYDNSSYYRVAWDSGKLHLNIEEYCFNDSEGKALWSWCENIVDYQINGCVDNCEIIGNIYDNPELLEVDE